MLCYSDYSDHWYNRKLCQGDLHTDVSSQILRSGHVGQSKDRSYSTAHSKVLGKILFIIMSILILRTNRDQYCIILQIKNDSINLLHCIQLLLSII